MVLTGYGKEMLSRGSLDFMYWVAFDDEVDYNPYISTSGTMIAAVLSSSKNEQIEESPIREATTGFKKFGNNGIDTTNVYRPMFTMSQGQSQIPRMYVTNVPTGSVDIRMKQKSLFEIREQRDENNVVISKSGPFSKGYERTGTTEKFFGIKHKKGSFPAFYVGDGFLIRVYNSGSDGLTEVFPKLDFNNEISFNNDLKLFLRRHSVKNGR